MKKLLLTCGAVALLTGSAGFAQAQVINPDAWLHGVTVLDKLIVDNEGTTDPNHPTTVKIPADALHGAVSATTGITIDTNVIINQVVTDDADDVAEASATAAQVNTNNRDCGNCAEKLDVLNNSSDNDVGLTSINQSAGNNNNQGTLVSAAVDDTGPITTGGGGTSTSGGGTSTSGDPMGGFAHAQAEATQVNGDLGISRDTQETSVGFAGNDVEAVDLTFRNALIDNSVNGNKGLSYVNQATGNNDNQLNELSLAFSERASGVAIAEADLGQFNTGNKVGEGASTSASPAIGINKNATVTASLNGNTGIFGVNQSVGNNGNQANIVSVAAVGTNLPGF